MAESIKGGAKIYGLHEFRLAIRREQAHMPAEMTHLLRNMGHRFKREMRRKMRAEFVPESRSEGALARDIHVSTARGTLDVTFGSVTEYAGWWEFGGAGPNNRPAPREIVPGGRTLFPTLKEQRPEIQVEADLYLTRLALELERNPPTRIPPAR